jgi:hypothetical protein
MISPGSRYWGIGTYQIAQHDGTIVTVTRLYQPSPRPVLGWHQRRADQHLDVLAYHFADDATATWQLCDTNGTIVPDALAARPLVAIPRPI